MEVLIPPKKSWIGYHMMIVLPSKIINKYGGISMNKITYVALDVHKKNIVMAASKKSGSSEFAGDFLNTDAGVKKFIKKLKKISEESEVEICYEAGPCGYALKRILNKHGYKCEVAAPSLIPTKSGDRIKTDKRDAKKLARLFRANELTFISVPNEDQESIRDFVRCREDLMTDLKKVKQRLNHFLIRHGYHYSGTNWTKGHLAWVKGINFENNRLKLTLSQYVNQMEYLSIQLSDMDNAIEEIASTDEYRERVNALCAFKGIRTLSAMILISEIIDFSRFNDPRDLMAYLGMVPSEYSSGGKIKKGSITKCGNTRARRVLIESAHHSRHKPVIGATMKQDLEMVDSDLRIAPVKALNRLHKRYYHFIFKGKPIQVAVVAVARELIGFLWHNMIIVEGRSDGLENADLNYAEIS